MNIEPLEKKIFDKALANGVSKIILSFSGGPNEGYLDITLEPLSTSRTLVDELTVEIEKWVCYAYNGYSGVVAGEANDYGDEIVYDLVNKKCSAKEWCMVRETKEFDEVPLEVVNVETIESDDE